MPSDTHPVQTLSHRLVAPLAATLLGLAASLSAQADPLSDRFDLHGYGYQSYMQTTSNTYYGADPRGNWDNNFLGLVMTATLTDQSKVWAQLQGSGNQGNDLTWFFIDYQLNNAVRLHAGRVKLPLGFYNEIIDAKSLHLSTLEPSLYQTYKIGPDMVHDAYHGGGIDIEQDIAGGHVLWQAWAGNVYDTDPPDDSRDRRAWGGRITYNTPVDGLTLMLSAYRTRVEILADKAMTNEDRAIASIGYTRDNWDLKAEYAWHKSALHAAGDNIIGIAWYVQGGYTVGAWTPFVRYDDLTMDQTQRADPSYRQRTLALGLGYQVAPNIGLRIENHVNRGYAASVASGETVAGAGERRWNMFVAAVNFKF